MLGVLRASEYARAWATLRVAYVILPLRRGISALKPHAVAYSGLPGMKPICVPGRRGFM